MKFFLHISDGDANLTLTENIFEDISKQLSDKKSEIDMYPHEWETAKRIINPYEYIYSSSYLCRNISGIKPVSRSYFKITEIIQDYGIVVKDATVMCVAEAPGGFAQCFLDTHVAKVHGITLISENKSIPYWNHLILRDKRFQIHEGVTKDGDLTNFKNILEFAKDIGKVSLVTGDGGFDVSDDYDSQERLSYPLIFSEVYLGLLVLEKGGVFICKIFDTFRKETLCLLGVLHLCFQQVVFHKPCMSRPSNSEKYVVCVGYLGPQTDILNSLTRVYLSNFKGLNTRVSESFLRDMVEYVKNYSSEQMALIDNGINGIKTKKQHRIPTNQQIETAINWCNTYDIPINNSCVYLQASQ
jgi:23S rRNA U2552 (ribose-2'-O)-methylase RlmE/FtsJ